MLGEHGEGGEITHVEHCQGGRASRWEHEPAPPRGLSDAAHPQPAPTHPDPAHLPRFAPRRDIHTHRERERWGRIPFWCRLGGIATLVRVAVVL